MLVLWAGLEMLRLGQAWRGRTLAWRAALRPGTSLALAALLLLGSGGRFTGLLEGSASSGLVWWWEGDPASWRLLGALDPQPGGVGLLALGPVVVAGIAVLLARRDRLVLALAVGAAMLALGWLVLRYEPVPKDIHRLAGHARNFALVALLLALSPRLMALRPRWRLAVGALLLGLIIWPTIVAPARHLGRALGRGIEVANAGQLRPAATEPYGHGRFAMPAVSARVAGYIRDHTAVDARVLVPEPPLLSVAYATGRPNGAGYLNVRHLLPKVGPAFVDARDHLEPNAMRQLGIDYVYATDDWGGGAAGSGAALADGRSIVRVADPRRPRGAVPGAAGVPGAGVAADTGLIRGAAAGGARGHGGVLAQRRAFRDGNHHAGGVGAVP